MVLSIFSVKSISDECRQKTIEHKHLKLINSETPMYSLQ